MPLLTRDTFAKTSRTVRIPMFPSEDVGTDAWTKTNNSAGTQKLATPTSNNSSVSSSQRWNLSYPLEILDAANVDASRAEVAGDANPTIRVRYRRTGTPASAATLSLALFEIDEDGAPGSDLCGASVNVLGATLNTWTDADFAVTGSALARGDDLAAVVTALNNDTGGSGGGEIEIASIAWVANFRG